MSLTPCVPLPLLPWSCDAIMPTQYHGGECMYNMDGCLMSTQPQGVMECGSKCQDAKNSRKKKGMSKTKRAELAEACKVRYPASKQKWMGCDLDA
jgi:hypothetical protein